MAGKKKKPRGKIPDEKELMKMEIAKELGLWEQVEKHGWESLSNAACGRVGGIMSKRLKEKQNKEK
jgi:small acid-soluble spore protein F (minor alpha/beta-type SASP)